MAAKTARKERLAEFTAGSCDEGDAGVARRTMSAPSLDTIHHDPGDPWEGKTLDLAGFQDRVQQSRYAFPDQQFAVQGLFADGDTVVVTWLWHATHAGDLPSFRHRDGRSACPEPRPICSTTRIG